LLQRNGLVARVEERTDWRTEAGEILSFRGRPRSRCRAAALPLGEFNNRCNDIRMAQRFSTALANLMQPQGDSNYRNYEDLLRAMDRYRGFRHAL